MWPFFLLDLWHGIPARSFPAPLVLWPPSLALICLVVSLRPPERRLRTSLGWPPLTVFAVSILAVLGMGDPRRWTLGRLFGRSG